MQDKPDCLLSSTESFTWNYALSTWIASSPRSPPEGDTLLAAHIKAFESLSAAVGNDVKAQWDPWEGSQLGEASLGRWGFPRPCCLLNCYPLPAMTVPLTKVWRGRQELTVLGSLAKLEKPWLVHKPTHQESVHWGREELVFIFLQISPQLNIPSPFFAVISFSFLSYIFYLSSCSTFWTRDISEVKITSAR